jgi:hypothetical protein
VDKLSKKGSKIAELIEKGREQGYLTYADVNDHLPEDISDPDQVDEIIGMINDLGLQVHETAPDADDLLLAESEDSDDIALEQAAEALAAVENETGRTTDPVRMYMREMGTVDLLTREGEIEIAKRIEEGMRDLLAASVLYPRTVEFVIDYHQMVKDGEKKINDFLTGFLEEMEEVPSAGPGSQRAKEEAEAAKLIQDAKMLEKVGCFAIVLEKIPAKLAATISKTLSIPVIGIGAGSEVDGQVLVLHDMLGMTKQFNPRFLRRYLSLYDDMSKAISQYSKDVKTKNFPNKEEQY